MFDIGFSELIVVFIVGLLILGPERLPHAAKKEEKMKKNQNKEEGKWRYYQAVTKPVYCYEQNNQKEFRLEKLNYRMAVKLPVRI